MAHCGPGLQDAQLSGRGPGGKVPGEGGLVREGRPRLYLGCILIRKRRSPCFRGRFEGVIEGHQKGRGTFLTLGGTFGKKVLRGLQDEEEILIP